MKTSVFLVFSLFLIAQTLHGQKFSYKNSSIMNSRAFTGRLSGIGKTDTILKLFPNLDLFHKRNIRNSDLFHDKSSEDFVIVKSDPSYAFSEEFPGSSIYYAKRSSLLKETGEKNFIINYLLIKDPKDGLFSSK